MPIEGFDYKAFAENMSEQAVQLVPQDLKDFEKDYIVKTLGNFTMVAGEALYNDTSLNLNADQAVFITQIIAEWSFHKSIDLVHSGILPQYWDSIMQKIAFTIFEVAKQGITRQIPQDQLLQAVEHHVVKVYNQCIDELQQKGVIDEEIKNRAESQSNIDAMAQQVQAEQERAATEKVDKQKAMAEESSRIAEERHQKREAERAARRHAQNSVGEGKRATSTPQGITNKDLKLISLALVLKILSQDKVTTILNKFNQNDSLLISQYMNMADLESRIDGDLVTGCLNEIKEFLPTKRKLTAENLVNALLEVYRTNPREKVEKIIKNERPLVKRFASKAYDGEYSELPLRVANVITEYIEENV